jgi:hypothetical protein
VKVSTMLAMVAIGTVPAASLGCDSFGSAQNEARETESRDPRVRARDVLTATTRAAEIMASLRLPQKRKSGGS